MNALDISTAYFTLLYSAVRCLCVFLYHQALLFDTDAQWPGR